MNGGIKLLDEIKIQLSNDSQIWIDIFDHSLSRKWLSALNDLLSGGYKLEKNYCWLGFADSTRDAEYLCKQINHSIRVINASDLDYHINDVFTVQNTMMDGPVGDGQPGLKLIKNKFNRLHRYFEDLQGTSRFPSQFYLRANPKTRWHIRQLNLLCHEFESWALSYRKKKYAPEWQRPSQLMCWLGAPRFALEPEDFEYFGVDTLMRPIGGVFVGINKAVGKHHWEVYQDEGRDSRIGELTTTVLNSQTEASGDFDIEWAQDTKGHPWMHNDIAGFRQWLLNNGLDPDDKKLTIGHPQVGQVDLKRSFDTTDFQKIWSLLNQSLDVVEISTSAQTAHYDYHWRDTDYINFMLGDKNEMV